MEANHSAQKRLRRSVALAALGEYVDGYDLIVVGSALLFLKPFFNLSSTQTGLLGAAAFLGAAVGLLIFGPIADRFGRRKIFMYNLLIFVVVSILSALVYNVTELFLARIAIGIAVGMDIPASTAYLSEVSPPEKRGRYGGALPNVFWVSGFITGGVLGLVLFLGGATDAVAWRIMFGVAAIPSAAIYIGRRFMKESPRWLYSKGESDAADQVSKELSIDIPVSAQKAQKGTYADLFKGKQAKNTILISVIYGLNCMGGAITTVAVPYILKYAGLLSTEESLSFSIVIYVLELVAVFVGYSLIDRIGRRNLGIISMFGAALVGLVLSFYALNLNIAGAILVTYIGATFLLWMGSGILVWSWSEEMFPTRVRSTGAGFCNSFCRLALAGNTFLVPVVIATVGKTYLAAIFSVPLFIIGILTATNRRLDTAGKELESITETA